MALAWLWAAVLVAATSVVGMVFPKLRPHYADEQVTAATDDQAPS